ncbi:hypothetical protein [Bacillus sp. FJAT-45350]|uniref:hypothetical protein n=1 Tax=Bacillus sp. FJAT-45350 TaxID=2011014 RepID=UPI000BB6BD8F|nr:hypothetical protein [Bacillus sp. FJAT-45350]
MKLNDIGITQEQMLIFFNNVDKHVSSLDKSGIEFRSKSYNSLRILHHKGYVYVWEYEDNNPIKFKNTFVDGFRCMPSRDEVNLMYVEIHANGGDSGIANPDSFDIDIPENVLCFLLDCFKPRFIESDIY